MRVPFALNSTSLTRAAVAAGGLLANGLQLEAAAAAVDAAAPPSVSIHRVLREPLPPEELHLASRGGHFQITGPTFTYQVSKSTGLISRLRVVRDRDEVISQSSPMELLLDNERMSSSLESGRVNVVASGKDKVMLEARGKLPSMTGGRPELDCVIAHTIYNDGVVVSTVKLTPHADWAVRQGIAYQLSARGEFSHYLHKRRDEHGQEAVRGALPAAGNTIGFATLSSCLSVFSDRAALAAFTDSAAVHLSSPGLETAAAQVVGEVGATRELHLTQHVIRIAPGGRPFVLKAGREFAFRTGLSVAPNRLPHRRTHDLRMFIWIGDDKFPYPNDAEIEQVARWGYTLFQMHRGGNAGEPRPPAGELGRVIRKVHELGMLFVWTENADLLYRVAPGVQALQAKGQWSRWQGFNYGGRYTDTMDPYCDLIATCLASPNGLAEYRLACIERMLDQHPVDGIYLDDNLAYPNCTLQKEHGHPQPTYDCLIELHEMNWRRRQLLLRRIPHAVLISHCTKAFVLPVIADFDALLYGEGYSFASPQDYWVNYAAHLQSLRVQGVLYAGGKDAVRCPAAIAYNYDLLSGGGQYCQLDWRLFREKFPHAKDVLPTERLYCETYNPAQFYFGLHESTPYYFATATNRFHLTNPRTHATLYHNRVWNEWMFAIANTSARTEHTSLTLQPAALPGLSARKNYLLFDAQQRTTQILAGKSLPAALENLAVTGENLRLLTLREQSPKRPSHIWGGKRISESWNASERVLTVELHGPPGLRDLVLLDDPLHRVERVSVDGQTAAFAHDPTRKLVQGEVLFTTQAVKLRLHCAAAPSSRLPVRPVPPGALVASGELTPP